MTTRAQTAHHKKAFLEAFRRHGNVSWACRETGTERRTIYKWQEHDAEFDLAFHQAEIDATETMEAEAYRRAVEGTDKPVYQGGVMVGTVREYSDTLLIFMLKARSPEKYRDRIDVTTGAVQTEAQRIAEKFGKTVDEVLRDAGVAAKARA